VMEFFRSRRLMVRVITHTSVSVAGCRRYGGGPCRSCGLRGLVNGSGMGLRNKPAGAGDQQSPVLRPQLGRLVEAVAGEPALDYASKEIASLSSPVAGRWRQRIDSHRHSACGHPVRHSATRRVGRRHPTWRPARQVQPPVLIPRTHSWVRLSAPPAVPGLGNRTPDRHRSG
jgi:hypothetical protein